MHTISKEMKHIAHTQTICKMHPYSHMQEGSYLYSSCMRRSMELSNELLLLARISLSTSTHLRTRIDRCHLSNKNNKFTVFRVYIK